MTVAVRFAPSPTGRLHVGNARTALLTWLFARKQGGTTWLRIDDTDADRSDDGLVAAIDEDLAWFGLDWDRRARQSERLDLYRAAIDRLIADGRLYPCYETAEELALKRSLLAQRRLPPIYDRAALALGDADRARLEAAGRRPHWRFRLDHAPIAWSDLVRGPVVFQGGDLSDPVVVREDGRPLYHLCSVVDDRDFAITHVVRGEDHVANTAAHVQMFQALGAEPPVFAHLPLLADAGGAPLSKRLGSLTLQHLRDAAGLEPMALASLLARLGTADPIEPFDGLAPLVAGFDFTHIGRAAPRFDLDELMRLNARIIHRLPFARVAGRLAARGLDAITPAFWDAVRDNLTRLDDAVDWWRMTQGESRFTDRLTPEDRAFVAAAAAYLPAAPWDETVWDRWIPAVKAATGRRGRALFRPLRLALTGREDGPELRALLPLMERRRVVDRLGG